MTRLAALAAVILLAVSACGGSGSTHGGSGVVTAGGHVGSLQIDVSTRFAVVAFAGTPDVSVTGKSSWPRVPKYHALGYYCSRTRKVGLDRLANWSCRTVYYVNARTARLVAFYTASSGFRTTNGIRPGMTQNAADRRAHQTPQGPWYAIYESGSDDFILPSSCGRVVAGRCSGRVLAFMLESRHHPIGLTFT